MLIPATPSQSEALSASLSRIRQPHLAANIDTLEVTDYEGIYVVNRGQEGRQFVAFDNGLISDRARATGFLWRHSEHGRMVGILHRDTGTDSQGVLNQFLTDTTFAKAQAVASAQVD